MYLYLSMEFFSLRQKEACPSWSGFHSKYVLVFRTFCTSLISSLGWSGSNSTTIKVSFPSVTERPNAISNSNLHHFLFKKLLEMTAIILLLFIMDSVILSAIVGPGKKSLKWIHNLYLALASSEGSTWFLIQGRSSSANITKASYLKIFFLCNSYCLFLRYQILWAMNCRCHL